MFVEFQVKHPETLLIIVNSHFFMNVQLFWIQSGVCLFCRHVGADVVPVVPAAVRWSGSGRGEDGGEPLEAPAGPAGEPDSGSPHRSAGLGRGGVEGCAEWSAGNEPGSDPSDPGVRGEVWPRCGGR